MSKFNNVLPMGVIMSGAYAGIAIMHGQDPRLATWYAYTVAVPTFGETIRSYAYASAVQRIIDTKPGTTLDKIVMHPATHFLMGEKKLAFAPGTSKIVIPSREASWCGMGAFGSSTLQFCAGLWLGYVIGYITKK